MDGEVVRQHSLRPLVTKDRRRLAVRPVAIEKVAESREKWIIVV
jgi:hypothetical protein